MIAHKMNLFVSVYLQARITSVLIAQFCTQVSTSSTITMVRSMFHAGSPGVLLLTWVQVLKWKLKCGFLF